MKYKSLARILNREKGSMIPLVMALIFFLAVITWALNAYMRHEKNLVTRMRHASIADKMAISAANEASAWFGCNIVNIGELLRAPAGSLSKAEKAVIAPLVEKNIENYGGFLSGNELYSFELADESGGTLNSVEYRYGGFKNYFTDTATGDYENNCYLPADPFERTGALIITARTSYGSVSRVHTTRYEIKITNLLPPVVSKFTFFARNRNIYSAENAIVMEGARAQYNSPVWHLGAQGIISEKTGAAIPVLAPLILIHHPDDIAIIDGYCPTHEKIREFLPPDPSVAPSTPNSYRPSMDRRGWVYFGAEPTVAYVFNISPGNVNPPELHPYGDSNKHKFYGNGFLMLESDLIALAKGTLKGNYPFPHSFADIKTPANISDYIVRIVNRGIYWFAQSRNFPLKSYVFGNYYAGRPKSVDSSSLIQISGDIQPLMFMNTGKPSRYLDRRSPTIVFGKAFRSCLQLGTISQNCVHPAGSAGAGFMSGNMHRQPFEACPAAPHPRVAFLPYFEIDRESGLLGNNAYMPFTDAQWHEARSVFDVNGTDSPGPLAAGFAKAGYDVRDDVFGCGDSPDKERLATYGVFMSKVMTDYYNRSNDWIFSNSLPKGGVMMPSDSYSLKKEFIQSIGSTEDQNDKKFFYERGGCYRANKIEIHQVGRDSRRTGEIFKNGIFKGNLRALGLCDDEYKNPAGLEPSQERLRGYDIRQKAGYVFEKYEDYKKYFTGTTKDKPGIVHLAEGGVFYIDSDGTVDMSEGGQADEIVFHHNTMLIFKKSVKIPQISKSQAAYRNGRTLTIVSTEGDIFIAGAQIAASLNALKGTIHKTVDFFQVFGNMVMGEIDFDTSKPGCLFKVPGHSSAMRPVVSSLNSGKEISGFDRNCVIYDPALDPCDAGNYRTHYKFSLASKKTYWKAVNE